MKKILLFLFLFFYSLSFGISNSQFDINSLNGKNSYVVDQVWILNSEQIDNLNQKIEDIRNKTTAEIFVAIIKSTQWQDISKLWVDIWQTLWVGKADKDNGLVILIAIDDKQWNISTWYWLEGILPDIRTKSIWEINFPNNFKIWDYYSWISSALSDIRWFLLLDQSIISKYNNTQQNKNDFWSTLVLSFSFVFLSILFFPLFYNILGIYKKKEDKKKRNIKLLIIIIISSVFIFYLSLSFFILLLNIIIQFIISKIFDFIDYSNQSWYSWSSSSYRKSSYSRRSKSRRYSGWSFGWWWSRWKW